MRRTLNRAPDIPLTPAQTAKAKRFAEDWTEKARTGKARERARMTTAWIVPPIKIPFLMGSA